MNHKNLFKNLLLENSRRWTNPLTGETRYFYQYEIDKIQDQLEQQKKLKTMKTSTTPTKDISKILQDKSDDNYNNRRTAVENNILDEKNLDLAVNDPDHRIRQAAFHRAQTNINDKHINTGMNDKFETVRHLAITHPNVSVKNIDNALKNVNVDVREKAVGHSNTTSKHLDKAQQDSSFEVRQAVLRNPKITSKQLTNAVNDSHPSVRQEALNHPNLTQQHLETLSKNIGDSPYLQKIIKDKVYALKYYKK